MKKNLKKILANLERTSDSYGHKLVGGFSQSYNLTPRAEVAYVASNNCAGADCATGCIVIIGPGPNMGCNVGCAA